MKTMIIHNLISGNLDYEVIMKNIDSDLVNIHPTFAKDVKQTITATLNSFKEEQGEDEEDENEQMVCHGQY